MTLPFRAHEIERLVETALKLAPNERSDFLDQSCQGDAHLRREVESRVAGAGGGGFFDTPAAGFAAPSRNASLAAAATEAFVRLERALTSRYRFERQPDGRVPLLGQGGMASVYLARDLRHHRLVAVKILNPMLGALLGRERFLREIQTSAVLQHPHILPLHDSGEVEGLLFYVMPYVAGESLRDRLAREGRLPTADAVTIAREVADALDHAHRQGVIHRDIKPGNILLAESHALVADFGIAKALAGEEGGSGEALTDTGLAVGTPIYMSPEQFVGERGLDGRSDIYSLGCVLYEMLAGHTPFVGGTTQEIMARHALDPVPPLGLLSVSESIEGVVRTALAKAPAERYASAREFMEALNRAEAAPPYIKKASKRLVIGWAFAGGLFLALFIAGVAWWLAREPSNRVPSPATGAVVAVLPFAVHGGAEFEYLGEGLSDLMSANLNGMAQLRSVDPRALLGFIRRERREPLDPDRGGDVARRFGANRFILGSVAAAGDRLRIRAALYDPSAESVPITEASVEGSVATLFDLADGLSARLVTGASVGAGAELSRTAAVSTRSLPALTAYLAAESALRAGRYDSAISALERATENDSTFALAWFRLSIAAEYATRADLATSSAEQAARHSQRLSVHHRQLLDAFFASRRGDLVEAERLNRAVIAARPEQVEAWFQLGEVLYHEGPRLGRPLADAKEPFERVIEFEPGNTLALTHLARLAASEHRLSEFDSLLVQIQRLVPQGDRTIDLTVIRAFARGDQEDIERIIREVSKAPPVTVPFVVWQVGAYLKDVPGAARLARIGLAPGRAPEWRALSHGILAHLEVGLGRWHAAREQLAALARLDPAAGLEYGSLLAMAPFLPVDSGLSRRLTDSLASWRAPAAPSFSRTGDESSLLTIHDRLHPRIRAYLLGLWSARVGALDNARRFIDTLQRSGGAPEEEALSRAMAMSVRAHVQARDNRVLAARLERVPLHHWYELHLYSPFYSMAYERYRLALALDSAGQEDAALRWYNSFQDHAFYDLAYLGPAHYRRGLIYQRRGDTRRAAEHLGRFIELWAGCDPELQPVVADARRRLFSVPPRSLPGNAVDSR